MAETPIFSALDVILNLIQDLFLTNSPTFQFKLIHCSENCFANVCICSCDDDLFHKIYSDNVVPLLWDVPRFMRQTRGVMLWCAALALSTPYYSAQFIFR